MRHHIFLFQNISFKKYFYVSLGNNFVLFFCGGRLVVEALGNCPVCPPLNRAVSGVMCVCIGTPGSALRRLGAVVQFSSPQSLLLGERRADVLLWNMPHLPHRRTRRSVYSIHSHSLTHSLTRLSPLSLQRVQNKAARIVLEAQRRSHASPLLRTLHWLPVQQRIDYKALSDSFEFIGAI